jgi:hypothetical protein
MGYNEMDELGKRNDTKTGRVPKQQHFGACAFGVYIIVIMHHWSRG